MMAGSCLRIDDERRAAPGPGRDSGSSASAAEPQESPPARNGRRASSRFAGLWRIFPGPTPGFQQRPAARTPAGSRCPALYDPLTYRRSCWITIHETGMRRRAAPGGPRRPRRMGESMLTEWLIRRWAGTGPPAEDPALRARYGLLEGWAGVILNSVLFLVKGGLGLLSGSIALIADAVHTLADTATSVVVIVGFRISSKPFDEEHPFGHGRAETITTLVIAVLLIVAGIEFLRFSIERLVDPVALRITWPGIAVLAGTLVIKEWLARFSRELGRRIQSDALEADFWHHRTDSIATGLVIAGFVLSRYGLNWVDGAAGIGVSLIIGWSGFEIGRRAVNRLLGQAPTEEEVEEIRDTAVSVDGVEGVHDVVVHRYGDTRVISLHIEVSGAEDAMLLHALSEVVEQRLAHRRGDHVVVHIDPINKDHPHYARIQQLLEQAVDEDPRCHSFHDLRIVGGPETFNVVFDLAVRSHLKPREEQQIKQRFTAALQDHFPRIGVVIQVEPAFARRN
ncbi:MAG: cation diffusion facilitator family transporter [Candidatus Eisenbacteria bacterium]|nr:cation diffusion facilitator family transporter [Candidatus Eisenbacteria bacterium]